MFVQLPLSFRTWHVRCMLLFLPIALQQLCQCSSGYDSTYVQLIVPIVIDLVIGTNDGLF